MVQMMLLMTTSLPASSAHSSHSMPLNRSILEVLTCQRTEAPFLLRFYMAMSALLPKQVDAVEHVVIKAMRPDGPVFFFEQAEVT